MIGSTDIILKYDWIKGYHAEIGKTASPVMIYS